ncbi:MAG: type III-B CRISPR module-associated protein Cmr5 [Trichlorobacter sp.]|nr:type III-B CRISPR module-associated protein Cmr5 [Trichlorobacter sp.]
MATKEQQRSAFALQQIEEVFGVEVAKADANFIVGTPTMILTNGIAQTMAFLLSRKKSEKERGVFNILKKWLAQEVPGLAGPTDEKIFLQKFASLQQKEYLQAQNESLALLQWLKRYARAFESE